MMAAAVAKRDLCYFTFDDADLRVDLHKIHEFLNNKKLIVSKYCVICSVYWLKIKRISFTIFVSMSPIFRDVIFFQVTCGHL